MTANARRAADVSVRDRFHRFVERILPWYDPAEERRRNARSAAIVRELRVNTRNAEAIRAAYQDMAERLDSVRR